MSSTARPLLRCRSLARTLRVALLTGALLAALATPAGATYQTLLRGLSNVLLAPLDAALAPVSTGIGLYRNYQDLDDSLSVKIIYPIPAYLYGVNMQLGCAAIRMISGAMEVIPGIPLVFLETDMESLFDPVFDADALAEIDIDFMDEPLRFGVNYTNPAF